MIRLLVADDHPLVRQGIKSMILENADMHVAAEAADGHAVLAQIAAIPVDAVLLDISMPGPGFPEVLRTIRERYPNLPVLVLSVHSERDQAVRALRLGATGFLQKDCAPDELATAIRRVAGGRRYVSEALAEQLAAFIGQTSGRRTRHSRTGSTACSAWRHLACPLSRSPSN